MDNKYYKELEMYVNTTVFNFLAPNKNFKSVLFKRHTAATYIRLVDVFGDSYYYNITSMNESEICDMICDIVAGKRVAQQITDRRIKREVAILFG